MKQNLKAWLGAFATLLIVAILGLTFAFKPAKSEMKSKLVNTEFRYIGSDLAIGSITDSNNWEISDGAETCELGDLPCVVAPDMPSITDEAQLVTFLENLPSGDAVTFVENKTTKHRD